MYLIMGREAMDTHFKLVMPLLKPNKRDKRSTFEKIMTAAKYYVKWYPSLYLPSSQSYNVKYLNPTNQAHLPYIEKMGRRLARKLFHTMAKYKEKLEFEQVILANFVDIGVDLFAMAAVLSYAEALIGKNPNDQTPQELADLFCKNARQRIEANFRAVGKNHNSTFDKVTETLMKGDFEWMYNDIYTDVVPRWREAVTDAPAETAGAPVSVEANTAEEPVHAPK